ncbi:MAG: hypothetical protein AB1349_08985 [Elusimicrobiota bacterium]
MIFLDILHNMNAVWLIIIIAVGLCLITVSVVLLLLEKAKRQTVEDFSEKDKTMIIGLVEERIDELTAKFDLFREDMDSATQTVFNKITTKIEELKVLQSQPRNQPAENGKIDALIPIISNLTEHTESISKKLDIIHEKLEQIEARIDLEMKKNNG